ncbi:MAG TPA: hypothetical protein VK181_02670 [Rhizobium sp.]|nr:hypothetical protein [Rhizobium sp.]
MAGLGDKIADKAVDYGMGALIWISGTFVPGLFASPRFQDPFYHAGWLQENKAWIIFFLALWVISFCAVLRLWGLVIFTAIAVLSGLIFGLLYSGSSFMSNGQQLAIWVVHGIAYSTFPGMVAGWVVMALKWTGVL